MKIVKTLILNLIILATFSINAQVALTTDGSSADASAMLEVKSTDKGILIPRVALQGTNDNTTISSPAVSLMVFNTATVGDVTPGFYYWDGTAWAPVGVTADGSETKLTAGDNVSITGSGTTASPYVVEAEPTHYVGELYGGGVVFWVDHTGQHGLIVSVLDLSNGHIWSNIVDELIGTTSDWNGASNTTAITGQTGHNDSAAKLCEDYTNSDYGTGIYSDWYLPSISEWNHVWNYIYEVQKALTNDGNALTIPISPEVYWSSSEWDNYRGLRISMVSGYISSYNKNGTYSVRAVRAF